MSSNKTPVTNRLQELRESAGLSQEQLGTKSGVSRATISSLETGRMQPSGETAGKIVKVLNRALGTKPALKNWDVFPNSFKDPQTIIGKKGDSTDD